MSKFTRRGTSLPISASISSLAATLCLGTSAVISTTAAAETVLEEVIVSARKRDESLQEIPDQVTVFNSQTIEDAGIEDLVDISLLTPGMFFSGDFFTGSSVLTMRGASQSNGQTAPVAFVIDGVTLPNNALFSQPLFDIQQVEVLRGPQGSLYGRNSLGGAINIVTKAPSDVLEGEIKLRAQEGEDYSLQGSISGPIIEGKLAYRLSAAFEDRSEGLVESDLGHKIHDRDAQFGRLKLYYTPTDRVIFDWRAAVHREERHPLRFYAFNTADVQSAVLGGSSEDFEYAFDGQCPFPFRGGLSSTGDQCPSDDLPAEGIYQQPDVPDAYHDWESFTQKLDIEFDAFDFTSITDYTNSEQGGYAWLGYARARHLPAAIVPDNSESFTQEFRFSSSNDTNLSWSAGLFYQDLEREQNVTLAAFDFSTAADGSDLGEGNVTSEESYGIFGQLTYDITDRLELTLGGRYDRVEYDLEAIDGINSGRPPEAQLEDNETFSEFQPKVSLSYRFGEGEKLVYATYSTAFRPGVINTSDLATPGDNVVEEETLDNYEIGFKSEWLDRSLIVNGAIYYVDIENWQYFTFAVDPEAGTAVRQLLSAPKANTLGAELEVTWRPTTNLDITAGYTLTDTEVEEYDPRINTVDVSGEIVPATNFNGAHFLYVPEQSVNVSIQYTQPLSGSMDLMARADWSWRDDYYFGIDNVDTFGEKQDAFSTTNLRLGLESESWRVTAYVNNVEDEFYATHSWIGRHVGLPNSAITPSLPRYYGVELAYNF